MPPLGLGDLQHLHVGHQLFEALELAQADGGPVAAHLLGPAREVGDRVALALPRRLLGGRRSGRRDQKGGQEEEGQDS